MVEVIVIIYNEEGLRAFFEEMSERGCEYLRQTFVFRCFWCGSDKTLYDIEMEPGFEEGEILIACQDCRKYKKFIFDVRRGLREA